MTKREAAIVSAYTGVLLGEFKGLHEYAEEKFGRPIFTSEFGSPDFAKKLKEHARLDNIPIMDRLPAIPFAPV